MSSSGSWEAGLDWTMLGDRCKRSCYFVYKHASASILCYVISFFRRGGLVSHTLHGLPWYYKHHRLYVQDHLFPGSYSFHTTFNPLYQIPGTIAYFFALYLPPNSFLYLRSFFFAQTAIWPTAIAINKAVLQCLLTIKIATQASDSKV